ncbi:MAG TPA: cytochrome c-type biogenesis CcmF C-terminal domain-containing protein, partial [Polyangiaceae bacterium]|nr:cytochrome c-type biogenesis CcmF C-terminal domain-containing protein [Polyangiaceae bacterium]
ADLDVSRNGEYVGRVSPAKFIYTRSPQSPTTEIALLHNWKEDFYAVVGSIDPTSKRATLQFHVNPFVSWIWVGLLVLITGASVSLWPELSLRELGAWSYVRAGAGVATGTLLAILIAMSPSLALGRTRSDAQASTVQSDRQRFGTELRNSHYFAMTAAPLLGLGLGAAAARAGGRRRQREHDDT